MSNRIPPLTSEDVANLEAPVFSNHSREDYNVARHAIAYAIQESQPYTEADVERVASALCRQDGRVESGWFSYANAARAAIIAMGHTIAEAKTDE